LSAVDLIEKRMLFRLLVPAYPGLIRVIWACSGVEHNRARMLRSLAGMAILFTSYLIIALAVRSREP
jgi:hypothetical protein